MTSVRLTEPGATRTRARSRWTLLALVSIALVVATLPDCAGFVTSPPPGDDSTVYNSLEIGEEEDLDTSWTAARYPSYFESVNTSFLVAGDIRFNGFSRASYLPKPNPDDTSQVFWNPNLDVESFRTYAKAVRDGSRAFALYVVDRSVANAGTCSAYLGVSNDAVPGIHGIFNEVPSDPKERWSFVFLLDGEDFARNCGYNREHLQYNTATHELGHQRAGLSHAEFSQWHQGKLPSLRLDVMVSYLDQVEINNNMTFPFDAYDSVRVDDHTSCQGWLHVWRSINN